MKKLFAAAILSTAGLSMSAHAGLISGTHVTADGKTVNLQGLEWMPLTYTAGLSRNQVEDAGGFTDRFGVVWNAGDWRYATRAETAKLLGSLWGGIYNGWSNDNYDGASWFLTKFGGLGFDSGYGYSREDRKYSDTSVSNYDFSRFVFGNDGECSNDVSRTCLGQVASFDNWVHTRRAYNVVSQVDETSYVGNSGEGGWFFSHHGLGYDLTSGNDTRRKSLAGGQETGSLLVRATPVNNPSAISLFALGLCGFLLRRRKIAA